MALLQRGIMLAVTAGVLAVPALSPKSPGSQAGPPAASASAAVSAPVALPSHTLSAYTPEQKEFYLSASSLDFIRPGLKIVIGSVTDMAPGKKPIVEVTFLDDLNQPVDITGGTTPGVVTPRFVVGVWDADKLFYTNPVLNSTGGPTRPAFGTPTDLGAGKYRFTWSAVMPTFDVNKPMTLFVGANRNMTAYLGKTYYAIAFKDFTPATGAAVASTWAVSSTSLCFNCHDSQLTGAPGSSWGHGNSYRDLKTCALCHNPNNMPTAGGQYGAYAGPVFWHQLHAGLNSEFTGVTMPSGIDSIKNCDGCHDSKAAQGFTWYTYPTRVACGSCHTTINWTTGANHAGGAQTSDADCAKCHKPQGDVEYDASIKGAHVIDAESKQLKGLKAEIVSVEQASAGQKPVVTFKVSDSTGVLDPKPFGSNLNIVMGGPAADYNTPNTGAQPFRENASGATFNGTLATYTMTNAIPADATGTWVFSMEVRRTVVLNPDNPAKKRNFTEGAFNPIKYVNVSGGTAVARRAVVDQALCLKCHTRLPLHGGQRLNVEECLVCHNANASDASRRPAANGPVESIDFRRMIHRLHTGEELTQEYTVYGFFTPPAPPNPVNFNEVTYPGDRRNCVACHKTNTQNLPVATGLLNVQTPRDYMKVQGPGTAACVGCHDARDYVAHAALNTATFGEACGTCHGATSDWSVSASHAR